jgi:hypothetical protein
MLLLISISLYGYQNNHQRGYKSDTQHYSYKNTPKGIKIHFNGGKIVRIVGFNKQYGKEYRPFNVTLYNGNKVEKNIYSKGKYVTYIFSYENGILDILSKHYKLIASIDVSRDKKSFTINSGGDLYDFENVNMYVEKLSHIRENYANNYGYNQHIKHKPNLVKLNINSGQIYYNNRWHNYRPINVSLHKGEAKNINIRLYSGKTISTTIKYINDTIYIGNQGYIYYSKEWRMGRDFLLHYRKCSKKYNTCDTQMVSFAKNMLMKITTKNSYR